MIRILLGLDDTPASLNAEDIAFALVAASGGAITGIGVIDNQRLAPAESTGIAGAEAKAHRDAVVIARAREHLSLAAERFTARGAAAGVDCRVKLVEADAIEALIVAAQVHDLIVLGRDTHFAALGHETVSPLVERFLKANPRPFVVAPEKPQQGSRTLVAYDGSLPAMRSLQLFCLMHLSRQKDATVVSVDANPAVATSRCADAIAFMEPYGFNSRAHAIKSDSAAAEAITSTALAMGASLIVMGAYGHNPIRRLFMGSTTHRLLVESNVPLFIHH